MHGTRLGEQWKHKGTQSRWVEKSMRKCSTECIREPCCNCGKPPSTKNESNPLGSANGGTQGFAYDDTRGEMSEGTTRVKEGKTYGGIFGECTGNIAGKPPITHGELGTHNR